MMKDIKKIKSKIVFLIISIRLPKQKVLLLSLDSQFFTQFFSGPQLQDSNLDFFSTLIQLFLMKILSN